MSGSVGLTAFYDDNIFSTPGTGVPDVVSRLSPRLGAAYQSGRFSALARYAFDADAFSRHPDLSTPWARQEAGLDLRWALAGGLALASTSSYMGTHVPGEFNLVTGLEHRRALARRLSTTQSLSGRLGARTKTTLAHTFRHDEISGGPATDIQVATASLQRQLGPVDAGTVSYRLRHFTSKAGAVTSHVLGVGWSRQVTSRTHLKLQAGPSLSGGVAGIDVEAALHYRLRRGAAALAYVRTETTVVGHTALIKAEGLSATVNHQLRRRLGVSGAAHVFQASGGGFEATVYHLGLDVNWRLSRHLSLGASHQLSVQRGGLGRSPTGKTVHNTALLRLVAGSAN